MAAIAVFAAPRADHVFIMSIDGGKPGVIAQSDMPVLKQFVGEGACTWAANTIFPSVTLLGVPVPESFDGKPVMSAFIPQADHFAPQARGTRDEIGSGF